MTRIPFLASLLALVVLIGAPQAVAAAEGRDPLASVVEMEAPQLTTDPPNLFTEDQRGAITSVVNEARLFGVPLVVRAITVPTTMDLLDQNDAVEDAAPDGQQVVQRMAEEWLAEEPVETSPGAEDGILLFVVVPEDDHRQSLAAFATSPKALPLNGLTRQRLDEALAEVIYPFFQADTIARGIQSGVAYVSYDNLFAVPARLERTEQQGRLLTVANGIAALTLLGSAALIGLVIWVSRRARRVAEPGDHTLSPFAAGAIARGRVDDQVLTGAILHLVDIGALTPLPTRAYRLDPGVEPGDPFVTDVRDVLAAEASADGVVPGVAIRRSREILAPAAAALENDLATRGFFNAEARVERTWMLLGIGALAALVLFTMAPSLAAMSRPGILAIVVGAIVAAGAWAWLSRRSWATPAGEQALEAWLETPGDAAAWRTYDLIARQDDLIAGAGGPEVPARVRLVREIRALGAG